MECTAEYTARADDSCLGVDDDVCYTDYCGSFGVDGVHRLTHRALGVTLPDRPEPPGLGDDGIGQMLGDHAEHSLCQRELLLYLGEFTILVHLDELLEGDSLLLEHG